MKQIQYEIEKSIQVKITYQLIKTAIIESNDQQYRYIDNQVRKPIREQIETALGEWFMHEMYDSKEFTNSTRS
jgi:hypothetical protein